MGMGMLKTFLINGQNSEKRFSAPTASSPTPGGGRWMGHGGHMGVGGIIWYHKGTIWYHMVPYGTLWYHMGTVWYHMVPQGTIWYHTVP